MQFRNFAENLLGSKVKVRIILYLLKNDLLTSERELAKLIGFSQAAVNRAVKDLQDANFISPMRVGNSTAWKLNKQSYAYQFITQLGQFDTPLEHLKRVIRSNILTRKDVEKAVIYGSIAEGRELPNSDIDLFVLVRDNRSRESLSSYFTTFSGLFITIFGNTLSLNIFTESDLKNPKNKKFVENVSKGIVVFEK